MDLWQTKVFQAKELQNLAQLNHVVALYICICVCRHTHRHAHTHIHTNTYVRKYKYVWYSSSCPSIYQKHRGWIAFGQEEWHLGWVVDMLSLALPIDSSHYKRLLCSRLTWKNLLHGPLDETGICTLFIHVLPHLFVSCQIWASKLIYLESISNFGQVFVNIKYIYNYKFKFYNLHNL